MPKLTHEERVDFKLWVLRACASDSTVQALPNQEKRAQVIRNLRSTLAYYRRLSKATETFLMYELCILVERSTSVREAISTLKEQRSVQPTQIQQTPNSNTGVTPVVYDALASYVAGEK